ncbi:MAG: hypothetical protein ACRYFR_04840 [Janthinobacterium lividum]
MPYPLQLTASDGSAPQVLPVPTSWADVTLAQYVALFAPAPDEARTAAELLCGLPAGYLGALAANDVGYLANLLAFAADPSPVLERLPTPGLVDVGSLPWGVLLLAQQALGEQPDRALLAYGPRILALYRTQLAFGSPLNLDRVDACEAALLAAPVTESYADLSHFLQACRKWSPGTPRTKTKTPTTQPTKKSKPAMTPLRNASGRFSAWIRQAMATS